MTADEALAMTRAQINEHGQAVSIGRYTGTAPNRTRTDTATKAFVRYYGVDELIGSIVQGDQIAIALVDDLTSILPVTTNDKLIVGGKEFAIKNPKKRVIAGTLIALEIHAQG